MLNSLNKLILPLVLLVSNLGFAQRSNGNAPVVQGVSTDTLNVGIDIPIVDKQGVGMPFNLSLSYNSNFWYVHISSGGGSDWRGGGTDNGWINVASSFSGRVITETDDFCNLAGHDVMQDGFMDGSGTLHRAATFLSSTGGMKGTCMTYTDINVPTTDGSGIVVNYHYTGNTTITLSDGSILSPSTDRMTDVHGNT